MASESSTQKDRRTAIRYRVPARAQLFWSDARAANVSVADISASGCSVMGEHVPHVGARVFLSLDVSGLPNVRLPATTVRSVRRGLMGHAAIRFDVPKATAHGLDRLLRDRSEDAGAPGLVLVVDSEPASRDAVVRAVRASGLRVVAVSSAIDAIYNAQDSNIDAVLARSDVHGIAALAALVQDAPNAMRIAYGRKESVERALALRYAHAVADDPTSPKCLGRLFGDRKRSIPPPS
jgi:CheY-like chemotaxis protein